MPRRALTLAFAVSLVAASVAAALACMPYEPDPLPAPEPAPVAARVLLSVGTSLVYNHHPGHGEALTVFTDGSWQSLRGGGQLSLETMTELRTLVTTGDFRVPRAPRVRCLAVTTTRFYVSIPGRGEHSWTGPCGTLGSPAALAIFNLVTRATKRTVVLEVQQQFLMPVGPVRTVVTVFSDSTWERTGRSGALAENVRELQAALAAARWEPREPTPVCDAMPTEAWTIIDRENGTMVSWSQPCGSDPTPQARRLFQRLMDATTL